MVRASRRADHAGAGGARHQGDFEVHPTMDRQFIYKILGGRIDRIGTLLRR